MTSSHTESSYSKRLAFETARNQVRYTLNRKDLLAWERAHLTRVVADLDQLLYPLSDEDVLK